MGLLSSPTPFNLPFAHHSPPLSPLSCTNTHTLHMHTHTHVTHPYQHTRKNESLHTKRKRSAEVGKSRAHRSALLLSRLHSMIVRHYRICDESKCRRNAASPCSCSYTRGAVGDKKRARSARQDECHSCHPSLLGSSCTVHLLSQTCRGSMVQADARKAEPFWPRRPPHTTPHG